MQYDLVFEGGGAKGMVFVGAVEEFLGRGHTYGRLLGTSAGAINAVLLAAGYSAEEMQDALNERENGKSIFASFLGEPEPFDAKEISESATRDYLRRTDLSMIPNFVEDPMDDQLATRMMNQAGLHNFFSLVERGGWHSAHKFRQWLANKLDSGQFNGEPRAFSQMNLKEFFTATGRDMTVMASDVSGANLLILNHRTAPDCPVVWAVRMSLSIPFLWQEVIWQKEWGVYRGKSITGHAVVDGGILSNFPFELFVSDQPEVEVVMGPKRSTAVLGLLIDEELPVPQPQASAIFGIFGGEDGIRIGELNTVQRIRRLVDTMMAAHDKMVIEAFEHLIVRLPAGGYGTMEFDMNDARRDALVNAGRAAMAAHLGDPDAPLSSAAPKSPADAEKAMETADRYATRLLSK